MDPLSALIGAGASLFGGFMNTSSTQAINAANIQQAQYMASGAYLPSLVQNAKQAGINPLAALGVHTPGFATSVPTDPGSGVAAAGKSLENIGQMEHLERMRNIEVRKGETEIQALNAGVTNTMVEAARNKYTLDFLRAHPEMRPEGASDPSLPAMGADWLNNFNSRFGSWGSSVNRLFGRVPQGSFNTP